MNALRFSMAVGFAAALGACALFSGMGDAPKASAYGFELQRCVETADARAEADTCRHMVDCKYGQGSCDAGH